MDIADKHEARAESERPNAEVLPVVREARRRPLGLALAALGIVYGDIGTSPLYAFKQAVQAGGAPAPESILGILSLVLWALIVIVSAKYAILSARPINPPNASRLPQVFDTSLGCSTSRGGALLFRARRRLSTHHRAIGRG